MNDDLLDQIIEDYEKMLNIIQSRLAVLKTSRGNTVKVDDKRQQIIESMDKFRKDMQNNLEATLSSHLKPQPVMPTIPNIPAIPAIPNMTAMPSGDNDIIEQIKAKRK
jgi:hypothetical protein